ncbi:hypothetical protein F070042J6_19230 [Bacteroides sp. f07]
MKYKDYTVKYKSTGNTHIDHADDIFCQVYRQSEGASDAEMLSSFIIAGGEIHDYGSTKAAITAYMRRDYPDNDAPTVQEYFQLQERQRELQQQAKRLIECLLIRHGGAITSYPITDEHGGCGYPVTMLFHGRSGSRNINITHVHLDEMGRLKAGGIDDHDGTIEQRLDIHPEHYAGTLAFLAFALGIHPPES